MHRGRLWIRFRQRRPVGSKVSLSRRGSSNLGRSRFRQKALAPLEPHWIRWGPPRVPNPARGLIIRRFGYQRRHLRVKSSRRWIFRQPFQVLRNLKYDQIIDNSGCHRLMRRQRQAVRYQGRSPIRLHSLVRPRSRRRIPCQNHSPSILLLKQNVCVGCLLLCLLALEVWSNVAGMTGKDQIMFKAY
jgi:hypothetical protein